MKLTLFQVDRIVTRIAKKKLVIEPIEMFKKSDMHVTCNHHTLIDRCVQLKDCLTLSDLKIEYFTQRCINKTGWV